MNETANYAEYDNVLFDRLNFPVTDRKIESVKLPKDAVYLCL